MKIRKLTIASLLTMGLVLTGCFDKKTSSSSLPSSVEPSSSQVSPVERISKTNLTRTLAVGEEVNLDDHITVIGGEGEKVYTAAIETGANVVTLEGKIIKAVAEGSFGIRVSAGEKSVLFEGKVACQARIDLANAINATADGYGIQMYQISAGSLVPTGLCVHQADYYAGPKGGATNPADLDNTGWSMGGLLRAENGSTYFFLMDDMEGANLNVMPTICSFDFANWSTNIDLTAALDVDSLTYVQEDDYEYFALSPEVPCGSGWDSVFANLVCELSDCLFDGFSVQSYVDYYASETGGSHQTAYSPMYFEFLDLSETQRVLSVSVGFVMDDTEYTLKSGYFLLGEAAPQISVIRDYIDQGHFPEPINYDEMKTSLASVATAKNYSYTIQAGWFTSTAAPAEAPTDGWMGTYNAYFTVGSENTKVTENGKYIAYGTGKIAGFIEHESKLYSFANAKVEEEWGTTLTATELEGKTTLWGDLAEETLAAFGSASVWTDFLVSSKNVDEDNHIVTIAFNGPSVAPEEGDPRPIKSG